MAIRSIVAATTALALFASNSVFATNAFAPWEVRSIYQIVTDRFSNGNTNNDHVAGYDSSCETPGNTGDVASFTGGDWAGVTNQMTYIKNLMNGPNTALWMSPLHQQVKTADGTPGLCGYHGYWIDYPAPPGGVYTSCAFNTEPHFGTKTELASLLSAINTAGMRFIQDIVPNHVGPSSSAWSAAFPNDFITTGCTDYSGCGTAVYCTLADLHDIKMVDPNTKAINTNVWNYDNLCQKNAVQDAALSAYKGIWGYRIDAIRHVPNVNGDPNYISDATGLIPNLITATGNSALFSFGENALSSYTCYDNQQASAYNGHVASSSMLNFPLYDAMPSLYAPGGDAATYVTAMTNSWNHFTAYPYTTGGQYTVANTSALLMVNFFESHDKDRLAALVSQSSDMGLCSGGGCNSPNGIKCTGACPALLLATLSMMDGVLIATPGIPVFYQGVELGMIGGGTDGKRRYPMPTWAFTGPNFGGFVSDNRVLASQAADVTSRYNSVHNAAHVRATYAALQTGYYQTMWSHCTSNCNFGVTSNVGAWLRSLGTPGSVIYVVMNVGVAATTQLMIPVASAASTVPLVDRVADAQVMDEIYLQSPNAAPTATTISGGYFRPQLPGKSIAMYTPRVANANNALVTFTVNLAVATVSGQGIYLSGSIPELANWSDWGAVRMTTSNGLQWTVSLRLNHGTSMQFKYILSQYDPVATPANTPHSSGFCLQWATGGNALATTPSSGTTYSVPAQNGVTFQATC